MSADHCGIRQVSAQFKNGSFERAVEHQRVEGDVHISNEPGGDDDPEGSAVNHVIDPADPYEQVYQQGDDGQGDVELDPGVESPHLQPHDRRQRTLARGAKNLPYTAGRA